MPLPFRLWMQHQRGRICGFVIGRVATAPNCLRCENVRLRVIDCYPGLRNYECPVCFRRYTQRDGGGIFAQWRMPITLPLYSFDFRRHLGDPAKEIAEQFRRSEDPAYLKMMCQEITLELDHPTQQVKNIHRSRHSESELRDFLRRFVAEAEKEAASS